MYKLTHYAAAELLQEHREELHGYSGTPNPLPGSGVRYSAGCFFTANTFRNPKWHQKPARFFVSGRQQSCHRSSPQQQPAVGAAC